MTARGKFCRHHLFQHAVLQTNLPLRLYICCRHRAPFRRDNAKASKLFSSGWVWWLIALNFPRFKSLSQTLRPPWRSFLYCEAQNPWNHAIYDQWLGSRPTLFFDCQNPDSPDILESNASRTHSKGECWSAGRLREGYPFGNSYEWYYLKRSECLAIRN